MAPEVLKTVGQVAGIGGVALGVFLLLYRDVIRLKVFPKLTTHQAFVLIILLLVLVWSVAISGLGVWAWVMTMEGRSHAKNSLEVRPPDESVGSASDVANEDILSNQEEDEGIRDSSPQAPKRGLSFASADGDEWTDDVGVRLRGAIKLQGGVTLEFGNLKTARPTYVGDRRTSSTEFSVSRRAGDRMERTSVDLRRVKSLLFLEPEELPGGRYQTSGSYLKIKITYQDGQSEITHCGRFGKLFYSPSGKDSEEFKVDFIEIREVIFV